MIISLLGISINILNYIYYEEEPWNHILWKSFYEQENIDNVFIGSSHVYCGVNPFILDEINGMNNFNLSAGSLTLSASYYLLKEADRIYDIKNAYIELFYGPNSGQNSASSEETIKNNWRTINYLKPSFVKFEFAFSNVETNRYLETIFPFIRYRSHLFDIEYMNGIIDQKKSDYWNQYRFIKESDAGTIEYKAKGYFKSNHTIESSNSYIIESSVTSKTDFIMPDDNCEYMNKIIDYCKDNDINLKFFVAPMYETVLLSKKNYDTYYDQLSNIANSRNVELYDFNLCKSEYLDIMHQQYFFDNGHLNEAGASLFTPFLWNILSNSYTDNQILFCDSFEKKISLDEPELYGIYYEVCDIGKLCTFASNTDSELEYAITFIPEDGSESIAIQDYSDDKEFIIKDDEIGHGILHAEARTKESHEIVSAFDINYSK